MLGSDDLYDALNVSDITDLLGTYKTGKALFSDNRIPANCDVDATINFYMDAPWRDTEYQEYRYTINCREKTYQKSRSIMDAVITEINRKAYSDYYIFCSVLATIPPADDRDNYNTPIQAIIKKR